MKKLKDILNETTYISKSNPDNQKGKTAFMKNSDSKWEQNWEKKIKFWRKEIMKMTGYETLE